MVFLVRVKEKGRPWQIRILARRDLRSRRASTPRPDDGCSLSVRRGHATQRSRAKAGGPQTCLVTGKSAGRTVQAPIYCSEGSSRASFAAHLVKTEAEGAF
jgi:hypothetical protein